jgi:hypothetical protein
MSGARPPFVTGYLGSARLLAAPTSIRPCTLVMVPPPPGPNWVAPCLA